MPTSPPLMPPPGWYADPEQAWTWRWWDGARWTEIRSPQTTGPVTNPYSFSKWFDQSFTLFKHLFRQIAIIVVAAWVLVGVLAMAAVFVVLNGSKGSEIRSLLQLDDVFGSGGSTTVFLTDAEADRVGELAIDLFWSSLPWMIALALIATFVWLWTTAFASLTAYRIDGDAAVDRTEHAAAAVRRSPVLLASIFVIGAAVAAVMLLVLVPLFIAIAADAGGGAIALTGIFGFLAAISLVYFLWLRLALAPLLAVLGGHGIGIGRSWELTHGHFWGVAGRLIIAGLIVGAVTFPLNFVNVFGISFGFFAYLAIVVAFQLAGIIASTLVSVPAQVVLLRHLTEQRATPLG